jgi:hypothetical protein
MGYLSPAVVSGFSEIRCEVVSLRRVTAGNQGRAFVGRSVTAIAPGEETLRGGGQYRRDTAEGHSEDPAVRLEGRGEQHHDCQWADIGKGIANRRQDMHSQKRHDGTRFESRA